MDEEKYLLLQETLQQLYDIARGYREQSDSLRRDLEREKEKNDYWLGKQRDIIADQKRELEDRALQIARLEKKLDEQEAQIQGLRQAEQRRLGLELSEAVDKQLTALGEAILKQVRDELRSTQGGLRPASQKNREPEPHLL